MNKTHWYEELIADKKIKVEYISTENMLADSLTKSLPKSKLEGLRERMGITNLSLKGECRNKRI